MYFYEKNIFLAFIDILLDNDNYYDD